MPKLTRRDFLKLAATAGAGAALAALGIGGGEAEAVTADKLITEMERIRCSAERFERKTRAFTETVFSTERAYEAYAEAISKAVSEFTDEDKQLALLNVVLDGSAWEVIET